MDGDVLQPKLNGGKAELLSHRLSDSDSECRAYDRSSQLSSISSQPSSAELQRPCTVFTAASPDSPDGSYQLDSPYASTTGPALSSSSSISPAEVNERAEQADEGSQGTGGLKAESELLDPWDVPFESSLPVRPAAQTPDPVHFLQDFLKELGTSVESHRACAGR
ncbi:hypothetical protein ABBQ38_008321 [Trebouxia sp. C0009 RCD-2024]